MEKCKDINIGNIEIRTGNDVRFYKYGLEAVIRSKNGQGWGLPLVDIEPDDLRNLADLLDEYESSLKTQNMKIELINYCRKNNKKLLVIIDQLHIHSEAIEKNMFNFNLLDDIDKFKEIDYVDEALINTLMKENYLYYPNEKSNSINLTLMLID